MIDPLIIGILGAAGILTAFVLNILRVLELDNVLYILLNLIGSGLMVVYAYLTNTIPFLILNSVWTAFSAYGLLLLFKEMRASKKGRNKESKL